MIRKATLVDIKFLNKIGSELNPNFSKLFHLETEVTKDFGIVLVYEDENKIKGFLYALDFGNNIDLLYIIVTKDYRKKHIASQLMDYLIANYQKKNKSITLEVAINNEPAFALYKKYAFKEVNRRKGYYDGVDALIMRRD